jgi:hypothetical protein
MPERIRQVGQHTTVPRPLTRVLLATLSVAVLLTSFSAEAAFHSRLGGQAYYDDELDVTWATDSNLISFGTWGDQTAGMSTLTIAGVAGWRLPDMDVNNDGTVVDCGLVSQAECKDNEFDHLSTYGGGAGGISFSTPGPFLIPGPFNLWSSTPDPLTNAYYLNIGNGLSSSADTGNIFGAWAVHDGDVGPEPPAVPALAPFGIATLLGLLGLVGYMKVRA